jgi:hypothetical protein
MHECLAPDRVLSELDGSRHNPVLRRDSSESSNAALFSEFFLFHNLVRKNKPT